MTLLHQELSECTLAKLDLFSAPMMQLSIKDKVYAGVSPLSAITEGSPI